MTNAVLAKMSIRMWSGRKTDEAVSQEIATLKNADRNAGRYVKNLIDGAAMKNIRSAATDLRSLHYKLTRPWDDTGRRLLPAALISGYQAQLATLTDQFNAEVAVFAGEYMDWVAKASDTLGDMFDDAAYPAATEIVNSFGIDCAFEPLPTGAALPLTMAEREDMARDIEAKTREALAESQTALFRRTTGIIRDFAERVKSYHDKTERDEPTRMGDSILREVKELAELLPKLNIENDPFLNGIAARVQKELVDLETDDLKEDRGLRMKVIKHANRMADAIETHQQGV